MGDALLPLAAFLGGLILLLGAGDALVRHAVHLAASYRVPKTVVGAVILGFGTSLPELCVSLVAAVNESPGIALGNVVGSNIANVGLILGLGALLTTLHVQRRVVTGDLPLGLLAAAALLFWVGPQGAVSRAAGIGLLCGFVLYLWSSLQHTRRFRAEGELDAGAAEPRPLRDGLWIIASLGGIALGAHLMVVGASDAARLFGVSERVIGLTVVALGTSLPELAATVAAARRREADLAVGNVAGSNLFNVLFVLGTTAVIHPVPVEPGMLERDFPALLVFSVLAFPLLTFTRRVRRTQGLILVGAYAAYVSWTWGLLS